jgi:hypothetical protein
MNEVVFLEIFGLLFDTSIIVEDELEPEDVRRTYLDKMDIYTYTTILSVRGDNGRACIPFK